MTAEQRRGGVCGCQLDSNRQRLLGFRQLFMLCACVMDRTFMRLNWAAAFLSPLSTDTKSNPNIVYSLHVANQDWFL